MNAPSRTELQEVRGAARDGAAEEYVVRWQSTFGTILIEVRGKDIFVNGDKVEQTSTSAESED